MFRQECWKRLSAGNYAYKNGIYVAKLGKVWVLTKLGSKDSVIFDRLKDVKSFIEFSNDFK